MAYGAGSLRNLMPQSDVAGKASQFYSQAQNQHYIPQGNSGEKSASGAVMSGMGGVMAGQSLSSLLPSAAETVAASAVPEFTMGAAGAMVPAGATAEGFALAGGAGAAGAAGLSMAAVAPWAVGALALGSYLFG